MELFELWMAAKWLLLLLLLGWIATPISYTLFTRLPDRGYAFSKMVALLLLGYIFWLLSSLGFLANNVGGIIFSLLLLILLSAYCYQQNKNAFHQWIKEEKRYILLVELLFFALFALWVWARAQNPTISATEKPMEFAFLNSIGRSASFPAQDPWLSGYSISYYYFGYIMISILARLTAVSEIFAFNLGIAWLVAGTGVGAFGISYNLINLSATDRKKQAVLFGLIAALAVPLAGNNQMLLEIAYGNGVGSPEFWQKLDIRDINDGPTDTPRFESGGWWWWRSSRVIHEYYPSGRSEEGLEPIAEFPGFSFILGDMHPHVLALPFTFLALAVALSWWLQSGKKEKERPWWRPPDMPAPLALFTIILLGGLSFLNTWDILVYLFLFIGAYALSQWRKRGQFDYPLLKDTIHTFFFWLIPAYLLYYPFYIGFSSQAGAPYLLPMVMQPTRLSQFFVIFGTALLPITIFLLSLLISRRQLINWKVSIANLFTITTALYLLWFLFGWIVLSNGPLSGRLLEIGRELNLPISTHPNPGGFSGSWGALTLFELFPQLMKQRFSLCIPRSENSICMPSNVSFLLLITGSCLALGASFLNRMDKDDEEIVVEKEETTAVTILPFLLLMILTAALLTVGPEFLYLRDNFGMRLNTIFKFYYQAWILFTIAGVVSLDYLWQKSQLTALFTSIVYFSLFFISLSFPYYGVISRGEEYRGSRQLDSRQPATLNGLAHLQRYNPDEYEAILWLRNEIEGNPVILEAVGGQYSQYARISANTGLPTVLGWAGHENQWRGYEMTEPSIRTPDVDTIYRLANWDNSRNLLNKYQVQYIYFGSLEQSTYGPAGYELFIRQGLDIAYQNSSVTIFSWQPGE